MTQFGAWGVSVFLILSGFLMIYSYHDRSIVCDFISSVQFAIKKIKALYPLHILTLIATVPFYLWTVGNADFYKKLFSNAFLLQSWFGESSVYFSFNGVAWYLSTCVLLYFAFPLIHKLIRCYKTKKHAYLGILLTFMLQIILAFLSNNMVVSSSFTDNYSKWFTYIFPVFRLGDFFIGCSLGYIFLHRREAQHKFATTFCELVTFLLIATSLYLYDTQISLGGLEWYRYTLLYSPTSVLLVYLFAQNQGYLTKLLANPVLIHLGNISAYTFLIHPVVIRYINKVFFTIKGYTILPWKLAVLAFVLTWIASVLYQQIERKCSAIS